MTEAMAHRGPDDRGRHVAAGVALGVRRLSIVDVAGGHQPVRSEDEGTWAVQNGELYNHLDIRSWLEGRGHRLRSRCDTEILPHLYEEVGDALPSRVWGMFGLAVWDGRRRRALLARDRLGIKPLYHARVGDLVVFGSELKSVLASGLVPLDLDYEAIDAYLTLGFVPGPATPLAAVRKLAPGHRLVIEEGSVRSEAYWRYPEPAAEPERRSEAEWAEELLATLDDAVRLRLMSDVPLGAMLSGGLDSSLIVALMSRHMREPVKTFSVGFAEEGTHSELADARFVSSVYGTDHHELELTFADVGVDLDDLVWHMDEPIADISSLGLLVLSKLAAGHVAVALCGQGADELLAGYTKHRAAWIVSRWRRLPRAAREAALAGIGLGASGGRAYATLSATDDVECMLAMSAHLDGEQRSRVVRGALNGHAGAGARGGIAARLPAAPADPLAATLHVDGQLSLVDWLLHYFDRASMAHSLEVRVPFLDHRVVELCARMPPDLKLRRLRTKHVLKRAARGLVPERIIHKRKLGFFRHAASGWLESHLSSAAADRLMSPSPALAGMVEPAALRGLVEGFLRGDAVDVHLVTALVMLDIWLESYLPRATATAAAAERPAIGVGA
jgi:asparagine synthase (glutamine-hydrolysing)